MKQKKKPPAALPQSWSATATSSDLGTGSTAYFAVVALGERVKAGLKIVGIPTSVQTADLARAVGIPLTTLDEHPEIDITIDGADEVDPKLSLIKGGGGALLREKVIASASKKMVVVADSAKVVPVLGKFPLPVEIIAFRADGGRKKNRSAGRGRLNCARRPDGSPLHDRQRQSDSRLQLWEDCRSAGAGACV